jgi:hypothetical protein
MANHKESATYSRRSRLAPHLNPEHQPLRSQSAAPFVDIDRLTGANGMVGIISQRRRDGIITFAIVREWETVDTITGEPKGMRGSFCPSGLISDYMKMVEMIGVRIAELVANSVALPFPLPAGRR